MYGAHVLVFYSVLMFYYCIVYLLLAILDLSYKAEVWVVVCSPSPRLADSQNHLYVNKTSFKSIEYISSFKDKGRKQTLAKKSQSALQPVYAHEI